MANLHMLSPAFVREGETIIIFHASLKKSIRIDNELSMTFLTPQQFHDYIKGVAEAFS